MQSLPTLRQLIIKAIDKRDLAKLQHELERLSMLIFVEEMATFLNDKQGESKTLLTLAANRGFAEGVRLLLAYGADPKGRSEYGRTALMYAVMNTSKSEHCPYLEAAKELLNRAIVDAEDENQYTALHYAIKNDNLPAIDLLIEHGADVNHKNGSGQSLVQMLISQPIDQYTVPMLKKLQAAGADLLCTYKGKNLLGLGDFTNKHSQAVCRYLRATGVDDKDLFAHGITELMYAILWEDKEWFHALLSTNINVNAQDKRGRTALMLATSNDNIEFITALIAKGAQLNLRDERQSTALLYANAEEVMLCLLKAGTDFNVCNNHGSTIFHNIAGLGCIAALRFLKTQNISVDIINSRYNAKTAIFLAVEAEQQLKHWPERHSIYLEMIKLLFLAGADPHIVSDGYEFKHLASKQAKQLIAELEEEKSMRQSAYASHHATLYGRQPIPTRSEPYEGRSARLAKNSNSSSQ